MFFVPNLFGGRGGNAPASPAPLGRRLKKQTLSESILSLVGGEGIEPSLHCWNQILSLARLPIPPLAHLIHYTTY